MTDRRAIIDKLRDWCWYARDSEGNTIGRLDWEECNLIIAALQSAEAAERQENALWWVLWHHQGGSSPTGQTLRKFLGIGEYAALNLKQLDAAKSFALMFTDAAKPSGAADEKDG